MPIDSSARGRSQTAECPVFGALHLGPTLPLYPVEHPAAVSVTGRENGSVLIAEGLARRYVPGQAPWCH
jgi:hypothetical protein